MTRAFYTGVMPWLQYALEAKSVNGLKKGLCYRTVSSCNLWFKKPLNQLVREASKV